MIILSCGHEVDTFDRAYDVRVKSSSREGDKAIAYMLVCGPCEDRHRQAGDLFDSDELANEWLSTEPW